VDALDSYNRAIAIESDFADAHNNRGNVLRDLRRFDDAFAAYDKALALNPDLAGAWLGRGNVFHQLRRYEEADAAYDKALTLNPDLAEAWLGRGNVFHQLRRYEEAVVAYDKALALNRDFVEAIQPLVFLLLSEGNIGEALSLARRALAANETTETKFLVASCLSSPLMHPSMGDLRDLLLRALSEPWVRPSELAPVCAFFLVLNDAIRDSMVFSAKAWPKLLPAEELASSSSLAKFAEDRLLRALLESTPVCNVALERFATGLRFSLLTAAQSTSDSVVAEPVLGLYCALARQCFINNYVFSQSDAEIEQARALRDVVVAALASGATIPALSLVAVAAYVPLHTLPCAASLLDWPWPDAVSAVLAQQVRAPIEERGLRSSMPVLTAIDDDVSMQVRGQYEENPYPQWVKVPPPVNPKTVDVLMREKFPLSPFVELGKSDGIDILVAGCGTGQHPIDTAWRFEGVQVLAVDLSLTSLCYAQRQTRALGLNTIQYAQADLMNLPSIGRTFDIIESSGVLHHLADPFAGWRVLLSMLRPGGIMRLGLYSETARRDIVVARDLIAARGYRPTVEDIRRCRQELLDFADGTPFKNVTLLTDFFSLSGCRDLLFHVQEHRLTLPEIAAFIAVNNLQFLGFDLDFQTGRNYARQFPGDIAMTDLAQWHRYETDNPNTFIQMYQFWVQRKK
jgi:tetratricopeptide (TPR) repeat protein/SAM-dependent methyltransferase